MSPFDVAFWSPLPSNVPGFSRGFNTAHARVKIASVPSHITHALHIEELLRSLTTRPGADHTPTLFHYLGAQGPDLFLHNRRRRPSGLRYGAIIHRGSIGRLIGAMHDAASALEPPAYRSASEFILGFAAHAVLDRACHPFINYFAGRWNPSRPESKKNRGMHSFLERLLDVEMLRALRSETPREYDFARRLGSENDALGIIARIVPDALAATYRSAESDRHLADRLENAVLDSYGFYRFINDVSPDTAARLARRRADGSIEPLWLTVVHPPFLPDDVDFSNDRGSRWFHPCAPDIPRTESFHDVFARAVRDGIAALAGIIEARETPDAADRIHSIVGDENLSDGGPAGARCGEFIADPLPLRAALDRLRERIDRETR